MGRETLKWLHRSTEVVAAEFVAFLEARDLDAAAVAAGDEGALRAAGWAPGLNAVEADIDFS